MGKLKQKFRDIKKFPDWVYYIPSRLMWLYGHLFFRIRIVDPNDLLMKKTGAVVVTWHNRLCLFPVVFPRIQRLRTMAVVSPSRDGQYIADFIAQLGIKSLRGSSSQKGAAAQLGAVHAVRDGYNVTFTPDGPRGPRYVMKKGPVNLASLTGADLIPVCVNYSRHWSVRSWDGFQLPKPFSTITVVIGDPITIPPDLSREDLEKYTLLAQQKLMEITRD